MPLEKDYYRVVANWTKRELRCFATAVDRGLTHGRVDVVGLRDAGGRLSGRAEVISIEVKRSSRQFAASVGQAAGYSIYADRCYLAVVLPTTTFTDDQVAIASRLGVGLLRISGNTRLRVQEVLSAPLQEPLEGLRLELIEKVDYSLCAICGSLFERGSQGSFRARVEALDRRPSRLHVAVDAEKGVMYWLSEQASRTGLGPQDTIYHRRYVCPDCVHSLFGHLAPE